MNDVVTMIHWGRDKMRKIPDDNFKSIFWMKIYCWKFQFVVCCVLLRPGEAYIHQSGGPIITAIHKNAIDTVSSANYHFPLVLCVRNFSSEININCHSSERNRQCNLQNIILFRSLALKLSEINNNCLPLIQKQSTMSSTKCRVFHLGLSALERVLWWLTFVPRTSFSLLSG